MSTTLHSFMDIFDAVFNDNGEEVQLKKIVIPIIQRDYAQGRKSAKSIREKFLQALKKAVENQNITLDFVYGDIKDGIFIPLDGQQRLTTLYLIHWYAARKENMIGDIAFDNARLISLIVEAIRCGTVYINAYNKNKLTVELYNDELGKETFRLTIPLEKFLEFVENANFGLDDYSLIMR